MLIWDDNGEETVCDVDAHQHTETDSNRTAAMSSSFPKSESTTSLLKSSSAARRPTHLPERSAESRRSQHHHQHQHQHHHRPAAVQSSSSKAEDSFWSAECDVSARRPLCHPSLVGSSQDSSNNAATRSKCKSHTPHSQVPEPPEPNGEAGRAVRERCRSTKSTHRHHHRRKHHRDQDRPPAAGAAPPEPEHPRRTHTHSRTVPRVPSLSDSTDDRVPLCEPRDHKRANSGGQVTSPSPSSCSLVPLSSRSSRRSRRSSAASSASEINLRTILNSLFGQVRAWKPTSNKTGHLVKALNVSNGWMNMFELPQAVKTKSNLKWS